jgi:hypothetical protein
MSISHEHPERASDTGGQEIEHTHESYEKGYPAPGTRHAGEEGRDTVVRTPAKEQEERREDSDRPASK